MAFALAFLAAIPGFAIIYWFMPYQFYHSTVAYEGVLDTDADKILSDLRDEVVAEFERAHGTFHVDSGHWDLNVTSVQFHSLKPEGGKVGFSLTVPLEGRDEHHDERFLFTAEAWIDVGVRMASWAPGDRFKTIIKMPTFTPEKGLPIDLRLLFPYRGDPSMLPGSASAERIFLPLSEPLNNKITGFANAVAGFPSRVSGSYARLFYFSAVTITTLGYGDIVPITQTARLLVAAESILGIVLIGLFLNSLFREQPEVPRTAARRLTSQEPPVAKDKTPSVATEESRVV